MFFKTQINLYLCIFSIIFFNTTFANGMQGNYIDFAVEGAKITSPTSINESGMVTGTYSLAINHGPYDKYETHAFIRMPNGEIIKFGIPGVEFTYPVGINNVGTVTGNVQSNNNIECHDAVYCKSFIRTLDGKIITFAVPEAKGGTLAVGINNAGTVIGYAHKNAFGFDDTEGFVRQADGTMITFSVPGARYTKPTSINNNGVITGCYDKSGGASCWAGRNSSGFLRMTDGTIITFNVSGADSTTYPSGINDKGEITGFYLYSYNDSGAFLRSPNGIISTFGPKNIYPWQPPKINNASIILGNNCHDCMRSHGYYVGLTREPSGEIREWKYPGDKEGNVILTDINGAGMAVGYASTKQDSERHPFLLNTKI